VLCVKTNAKYEFDLPQDVQKVIVEEPAVKEGSDKKPKGRSKKKVK